MSKSISSEGATVATTKKTLALVVIVALFGAFVALVTFTVTAAPASADANGNCGGAASNVNQLYAGWQDNQVISQVGNEEKSAGYNPINGSLRSWVNERVVLATLAKSAQVTNYGCRDGKLFSVPSETQPKGHHEFVALPKKYAKSDVSTTFHKGWKKIVIRVRAVADSGCGNPNGGWVIIIIWIHPPKKCVPPSTGTPPNCHKPHQPTISYSVGACNGGYTARPVIIVVKNPNSKPSNAKNEFLNGTRTKHVSAKGKVSFTYSNVTPGSHRGKATLVKFHLSKTYTVSVAKCTPPKRHQPTISYSVGACNGGYTARPVVLTYGNPNSKPSGVKIVFLGTRTDQLSANGQGTQTYNDVAPGTYNGTITLTAFNLSTSFSVSVAKCTPPAHGPKILDYTQVNDLQAGDTIQLTGKVQLFDGHSGVMDFSTCQSDGSPGGLGYIADPSTFNVSGVQSESVMYTAPDDGTTQNQVVYDYYCLTVTDSVNGLQASVVVPVKVTPLDVHPNTTQPALVRAT